MKPNLINCPTCQKEVAKSAPTCPHCGARLKKKKGCFFWILIVLGVFVFLGIIGAIFGSDTKQSSTPTNQSAVQEQKTEPAITVNLKELCEAYKENEVAADQKYKNKLIQTTGAVEDVKKDITDTMYVVLDTGDLLHSNKFSFSDKWTNEIAKLKKGQTITIKGRVRGYSVMIVSINDCELIK